MDKLKSLLTRKYTKTEAISIILSIIAVGVIIDIYLGRLNILFIAVAIFFVATGSRQLKRKRNTFTAYILLIMGAGFLLFSLFTSFSFTLIFATLIIYNSYQLFRSSSNKSQLSVNINPDPLDSQVYAQTTPYFKNKLIGEYRDFQQCYALEDINLQTGFGDVSIDLSDTIIPLGETVVLIRGLIGNIDLNVPLDVGMSVQMSLLFGKMNLSQNSKTAFNVTQKYQSIDYKNSSRKIKIIISLLIGDIEVNHR